MLEIVTNTYPYFVIYVENESDKRPITSKINALKMICIRTWQIIGRHTGAANRGQMMLEWTDT